MATMKSYEEKDLLYRVRAGDEDAFRAIYDFYYPKLRAYVLHFVKAPQYTEDIVQDVFIKIWETRESVDPEKFFAGYLFTITKNLVFKFFKNAADNTELVDEVVISYIPSDSDAGLAAEWKELQSQIQMAINTLPPKRKEVFLLSREENLSYEQIANRLGISRNTIKEHIVHAMKSIKEQLKNNSIISVAAPALLLLSNSF